MEGEGDLSKVSAKRHNVVPRFFQCSLQSKLKLIFQRSRSEMLFLPSLSFTLVFAESAYAPSLLTSKAVSWWPAGWGKRSRERLELRECWGNVGFRRKGWSTQWASDSLSQRGLQRNLWCLHFVKLSNVPCCNIY